MKIQKKESKVLLTTVTAAFVIAIGSISLAADKTAKPENTVNSKTAETTVEALADGRAVHEIPALAAGHALFEIPAIAANDASESIKQAKADYETKQEEERKAAEEAEQKRLEESMIAEEKQLAEERQLAEEAVQDSYYESLETSQNPVTNASPSEQELLAALIFCEAGNQPYEGQVAVGAVVMNRVRSSIYPNSISEVIYQSGQFSPAMTGWLDSILTSGSYTDSAMQAAADALAGSNPIGDLLYFDCSGWGYQIGDHFFH